MLITPAVFSLTCWQICVGVHHQALLWIFHLVLHPWKKSTSCTQAMILSYRSWGKLRLRKLNHTTLIEINVYLTLIMTDKLILWYNFITNTCIIYRNQGGLLWCVIPEALLDHQDFLVMDEGIGTNRNASFNPQSPEEFDCLSKQAWTHLLMQIIKVYTGTKLIMCIAMLLVMVIHEGAGTPPCD